MIDDISKNIKKIVDNSITISKYEDIKKIFNKLKEDFEKMKIEWEKSNKK
jgi:hypothetical protein